MKKFMVLAIGMVLLLVFNACEPESDDPPVFDNGLMVTLGQNPINAGGVVSDKDFTARSYVSCKLEFGNIYTFTASTSKGEVWTVKFKWDSELDDSLIYLNDYSSNNISLSSTEVGDYYINSDSDNADKTFIKLLKIVPDEIIEAEFEGFILKSGSPAVPDTLKNGYFITKKFEAP